MLDPDLTARFTGRTASPEKLQAAGWFNQGSERAHYGFPRSKALWLRRLKPALPDSGPVMLFVLLRLGEAKEVTQVDTVIAHVHAHGAYDEVEMELVEPDLDNAREAIAAGLEEA